MLALKVKDLKSRVSFKQSEKYNLINKFVFVNSFNSDTDRFYNAAYSQSSSKSKRGSKTQIVRRCVFNNRGRGVLRPFGISRIYLRELLQFGQVSGYFKAVW
jgi:ribosomal protein S14